mgnify:CR=1 FL=1
MSCSNPHISDIEALYKKHDEQFKTITKENIDKYEAVVADLYLYYVKNNSNIEFKSNFKKVFSKHQRRSDIIIKKSFIVYVYQKMIKEGKLDDEAAFWLLIQKCPARNISGVNSFALLLSPHPNGQVFSCKHNCYYCPDESIKNGAEDDIPRSYLKKEPAVARGFDNKWDAYEQMISRMSSLVMQGHEVDKLELIIEGGTYTEFPVDYLLEYHRDIFYSANTFFDLSPKRERYSLEEEIRINKSTRVRIIGICIETRPDAIDDEWVIFFRSTGTTRIQLGVQHTNNKLLKRINRGHTFEQAVNCIEYLKNNCFKVDIHLMPDLPGSTPELDKEMFDIVYKSAIIQPDQTKIYPCEVVPWTEIKKWHDEGKYIPYSDRNPEQLVDVITHAMIICPPWVRVPRIVRDIPLPYISGGNRCMNLRQVIDDGLKRSEKISGDIRSREIGRHLEYKINNAKYIVRKYIGSNSVEYFISLESNDKKVIYGFLRLRIAPNNHKPVYSVIKNTGLVRELHVYNNIVPVGKSKNISTQHLGIGKTLLKIAEYISWFYGLNGVSVITGEGVREYYHKRGYESIESYAIKKFQYPLLKISFIIYLIKYLSLPFRFIHKISYIIR